MKEYDYEILNEFSHYFSWREDRSPTNPVRIEDIELIVGCLAKVTDFVKYVRVSSIEEFHIDDEYSLISSDFDGAKVSYVRFSEAIHRVYTDDKYIDLPSSEMYNKVMSRL